MPIPKFNDEKGILPPGTHDCSLKEAEKAFVSPFHNSKRKELWDSFLQFLEWVKQLGIFEYVYINGSFVTDKPNPDDIDVILELPSPNAIGNIDQRIFDQNYVCKTYKIHLFLYWKGIASPLKDFREFFQYLRPEEAALRNANPGDKKGILRVKL